MRTGRKSTTSLEREVFIEALERPDAKQRSDFLDSACGTNIELRRNVEDLLREADDLGGFLQEPVLAAAARKASADEDAGFLAAPITEQPGDYIGRYKLIQKLGEGGCGVVYLAEQIEPIRREVALKIIKAGMDTRRVIARFQAERQTLALMDHPNIARVFDAGATESGRPYFVMELVRAVKLTDYCDRERLGTRERLTLFIQVCCAIQHAHQKGIIHRDIKPSNVLVSTQDGKPVPKVIDFGIAKATQQQLMDGGDFTRLDQFVGTPTYMSPEQAESGGLDLDTRTDIYSLGVLLYELLSGGAPFDGEALMKRGIEECRRTICEQEPLAPSTHLSTLQEDQLKQVAAQRRLMPARLIEIIHGDLDWIILKALEKDRTRRYATAAAFAQDLDYYLANEPVLARPPSSLYRLKKLIRRRRGVFAAATGITLALLLGTCASVWQAIRATQAENDARLSEKTAVQLRRKAELEGERARAKAALARLNEYTSDINLAQQSLAAGNYGRAVYLLKKHRTQPGETDLRGFEWRYLWQVSRGDQHTTFPNQKGAVRWTVFSASGQWLALGLDNQINIWDISNRTLVKTLPIRSRSAVFSKDNTHFIVGTDSDLFLFDTSTWSESHLPSRNNGPLALSPDGSLLAAGSPDGVRLRDTASWQEQALFSGAYPPLAFSRDGKSLVANTRAGVTLWDLSQASPRVVLDDSEGLFGPYFRDELGRVVTFTGDGEGIIAPRNRPSEQAAFEVGWWDARSGKRLNESKQASDSAQHTGLIACLALAPDGRTLATASMDHSIRLWDAQTHQLLTTLHGHLSEVWALAFSPDGATLVSGAKDGSVSFWAIPYTPKQDFLPGPDSPIAFSQDSRQLAVWDREHHLLRFINVEARTSEQELQLHTQGGPFSRPVLSADLGLLAEPLRDGTVRLLETTTAKSRLLDTGDGRLNELALSPDGRQLITGGFNAPLRWWDLQANTNSILAPESHRVFFSPDGGTLALLSNPERLELWSVSNRCMRVVLRLDSPLGLAVAFSHDGRLLAAASNPLEPEQSIRIWETVRGSLLGTCIGHKQGIVGLAFSADNKTLGSASHDNTLKLWNVATQQELLSLSGPGLGADGLVFSPDGRLLACNQGLRERGVRVFSASPNEEDGEPIGSKETIVNGELQ
jgi:WD40 repeat protein/serine/threonine protein kinase